MLKLILRTVCIRAFVLMLQEGRFRRPEAGKPSPRTSEIVFIVMIIKHQSGKVLYHDPAELVERHFTGLPGPDIDSQLSGQRHQSSFPLAGGRLRI